MKCPACGAAELIHDTRDMPYVYKGEQTVIPAVCGDWCPACGESILDAVAGARVMDAMRDFSTQINAAAVPPSFLTNVRKKLRLTQAEAATIFGGGINAFSRYEKGRTRPPLSLVNLFKILDVRPELLAIINNNQSPAPVTASASTAKTGPRLRRIKSASKPGVKVRTEKAA